jgi:hypothetical protein
MDDEQTDPKTESKPDSDRDRREALRTVGKAAVYVAPAVIAMLSSTKAMAR